MRAEKENEKPMYSMVGDGEPYSRSSSVSSTLCDVRIPEDGCCAEITLEPSKESEAGWLPRDAYPDEHWKTVQAFLFLLGGLLLSSMALAYVHDIQPISKPLPDIVFKYFSQVDTGLEISEYMIMLVSYSTLAAVLCHQHRWIILRRVFVMSGLLYIGRAVTMFVTVLPQANLKYPCAAKANATSMLLVLTRALSVLSGLGMSINGTLIYCGDFIYSGHTCSLIMCCLVFSEYTPQSYLFFRIGKWLVYAVSAFGIMLISLSRTHYTIDIIIAYAVTSTLFRIYHTIALHAPLKTGSPHNHFSRMWIYRLIIYFEKNVPEGQLPMRLASPAKLIASTGVFVRWPYQRLQTVVVRFRTPSTGSPADQARLLV